MGDYLSGAMGLAFAVRRGAGSLVLRADAQWASFGNTTVTRPYNGAGPAMDITSSAKILTVVLGPETSARVGPFRAVLSVQGGAGYALTTGSTVLPGDPAQVNRSNSYSTFTWAVAARAGVSQSITDDLRLHWELAAVQLGETDFLREYNLPIGAISGIYLNPTPYKPLFAQASIGLSFPL